MNIQLFKLINHMSDKYILQKTFKILMPYIIQSIQTS
jgi:hypothetical protein